MNMRKAHIEQDAEALLAKDGILSVADFALAWPDMPLASVYTRIRSLQQSGRLSQVGRGKYQAIQKPAYSIPVTEWMIKVNKYLIDNCEGINHCLCQHGGNLYVETSKSDMQQVYDQLKERFQKVVTQKDANRFPAILEGYIIVGHLISDAPLSANGNLQTPSLEKQLVDSLVSKQDTPLTFQKALEVYPVNMNRLRRYASRRGVSEELSARLSSINQDRIRMFAATQKYLSSIPVQRAWVFGSFARGEETPSSDLDLLVDYDKDSKLSLLDVVRFQNNLEKIIGREVDLIENGSLKPFAIPSSERDKYLIYER